MHSRLKTGIAALLLTTTGAMAQDATGGDLFDAGAALYEDNCGFCHMETGEGDPPTFPALKGNANLADLDLIVSNIHLGKGNMPPFPDFAAEEVAALATYVRNAWDNDHGAVDVASVDAVLSGLESSGESRTVWDGVYTKAQARRGRMAYSGTCSTCHGRRLNGAPEDPDMTSSPPLARVKFLRNWEGRSLAALFEYTRATMPQSNPGYMSDETYIDIIAHMLELTNLPAGDAELSSDPADLARIVITQEEP